MRLEYRHFRWIQFIWDSSLSTKSKVVAAFLADCMNANADVAWPSLNTLAVKTSQTQRSVQNALNELEKSGWITREPGGPGKGSTRYFTHFPRALEVELTGSTRNVVPKVENHIPQDRELSSLGIGNQVPPNNPVRNNPENNTCASALREFQMFWAAYPRKQDRAKAEKAFKRLGKADQEAAIADCATRYEDCDRQFVPYATTYLHGRRWEDPIERHESMPASQDEWEQWGRRNGLPAGRTETYREWIPRLRQEWRKRHSA